MRADREFYGRLVESAGGAHLANAAARSACELFYWRQGDQEVDFVVRGRRDLTAIEVKSSSCRDSLSGIASFVDAFKPDRTMLIGADGIDLADFLTTPVEDWIDK